MGNSNLFPVNPNHEILDLLSEILVYCFCRLPDRGDDMVQCELCHEWYHFSCVDIKTGNKALGLWLCEHCDKHGP